MVAVYPVWKSQFIQITFYLFNVPGDPVYQHTTGLNPRHRDSLGTKRRQLHTSNFETETFQ